jgi:tRNA threonylcarbamoyladenosine biosynthesis protein TsaE
MQVYEIRHLDELESIAEDMLQALRPHKIFAFSGEMGAGKTSLILAMCKVLGCTDSGQSPTFSLVNEYLTQNEGKVFHFDFYRIANIGEAWDMGAEEYFYSGSICFIEWPEKVSSLLPEETVYLHIEVKADQVRRISVKIPQKK